MFAFVYVLLFISCFSGLFLLMMISQKHRSKFSPKLSPLTLKRLGISTIIASGILSVLLGLMLGHVVYTVMAWCLIISLAAAFIYIGLMVFESKQA